MADSVRAPQPSRPSATRVAKWCTVSSTRRLPRLDARHGRVNGQRVFEKGSSQAWKLWKRMKMILNEYRLMSRQKRRREIIVKQMNDRLLGEDGFAPGSCRNRRSSPASGVPSASSSSRGC